MGRVDRRTLVRALLATTLALGCATKQDVLVTKLRGRANGQTYPVTVDQAWQISKAILQLEPTDAIEEYRRDGYMLTSQNASGLSAGTYIGVFVEPGEHPGECKVSFVARRKSPAQAYPALDEATFHKKFRALIGLIDSVGSLRVSSEKVDAGGAPEAAAPADAGSD